MEKINIELKEILNSTDLETDDILDKAFIFSIYILDDNISFDCIIHIHPKVEPTICIDLDYEKYDKNMILNKILQKYTKEQLIEAI